MDKHSLLQSMSWNNVIFLDDTAPGHWGGIIREPQLETGVPQIGRPALSTDLNSIENL